MKKRKLIIALLFVASFANAQYTKLLDFNGTAFGSQPLGDLISDGTFLYGMNQLSGINGNGVIFKIKPNGTACTKLFDFDIYGGLNGREPYGNLISAGIFLYGMTSAGGTNDKGTIFKIKSDGTGYAKIFDFATNANGTSPLGSLISVGTFLYGMTEVGGTYSDGVLFKIKPDGTGYVKVLDFAGTANGRNPWGNLISDSTFFYGMTKYGGINDSGTVFKIKPDGTGFVKLTDFSGAANGKCPQGSLISVGTFLYGMTSAGGTNNMGTIFKIKPDGTGYSKLLDFSGVSNGYTPLGSLISDGIFLYGMTRNGGIGTSCGSVGCGIVFKIKLDGTGYSKLLDFTSNANGGRPDGSLISDGTFLYGMTSEGGIGAGTVFKYCITPITFTQTPTICAGHSLIVGTHTYSASGIHTDTIISFHGCDSIVTTNLTVNTADTSVSVTNTTLTSGTSGASYQWINCSGNTAIAGQTNQSFIASTSGNYAVVVTHNSCIDTSSCHHITVTGVLENNLTAGITISPNPFSSQTTITFNKEQKNTIVKIMDESGKVIKTINFTGKELIIEKGDMKTGTYFMQITDGNKNVVNRKIVLQ